MKQRLKPSERVRKAMARITRAKAIPASEAEVIATALTKCVAQMPGSRSVVRSMLDGNTHLTSLWMFKGEMVGAGNYQRYEIRRAFEDAMTGYIKREKNHPGFCDLHTRVTFSRKVEKLWKKCEDVKDECRAINKHIQKLKGAIDYGKNINQ